MVTHNDTMNAAAAFIVMISTALFIPTSIHAAEIDVPNVSLTPDGSTTQFEQDTDIKTPNGGVNVLATSPSNVVYFVTKVTFGVGADAHLRANFETAVGGANRLGVTVQDNGLIEFYGTGDAGRTTYDFSRDMAGATVVLLAKLMYHADNSLAYRGVDNGSDTLMNVWVNPTAASVEGSGTSAGDMHTVWNSANFAGFEQAVHNESTPGTAADSSITDTVILTGADATWEKALQFAIPATGTLVFGE